MDRGRAYVAVGVRADFTVSITSTICEIPTITLDPGGSPRQDGGMSPALTRGTDAGAVAGRIGHDLKDVLDRWEAHLRARHCSEHSIAAMLGEVRRGVKMREWSSPADFTFVNIMEHLESFEWAASTFNRNLSVFRSLTRWMVSCEMLPADPLRSAQRADGAGGPGSRAASTDEARAIIRAAWLREQKDGRARRTARSLYWACLFLTGARMGEPGRWRWGDLILDEPIQSIIWTPETQKSKRREEIVICDQLAALLRLWRDEADDTGRDASVFPSKPNKRSFADDRNRAGVPREDRRGRPLTAHSARKWFRTTLIRAGVAVPMVNKLMRHSEGTPGRYYDPTRQEMAEAANLVDFLWPVSVDGTRFMVNAGGSAPKSWTNGVDTEPEIPDAAGAKAMRHHTHNIPQDPRPLDGSRGLSNPALLGGRGTSGILEVADELGDRVRRDDGLHPGGERRDSRRGRGRMEAAAGSPLPHGERPADDRGRGSQARGSGVTNEQTPPAFADGVRSGDFGARNVGSKSAALDLLRAIVRVIEEGGM